MKPYGRILLGLLFIAFVVEIVVFAPVNVEEDMQDTALEDEFGEENGRKSKKVSQTMRGVHLIGTNESEKEWELRSKRASGDKRNRKWKLKKVNAVFFAKDGTQIVVVGKRGTVETETKNMTVKGDVTVKTSNGYRFTTNQVIYDSSLRELISPSDVKMIGPKDSNGESMFLSGQRMKTSLIDSKITVSDRVRAQKIVKNDKKIKIQSEKAIFSGVSRLAMFHGNVVIDVDTMRITGPMANFKYNKDSDIVDSVFVNGGVKVSDTDKWATSRDLSVNFEKDKFIFQGSPKVVQNNDELRGEKIIFLNGGKRVLVQKARAKVTKRRMESGN